MSTCGEPCDGCSNRAEHHLCDACCHDEVNAIQKENRELREEVDSPAIARRIVTYDLSEAEREELKKAAEAEGRTVSRWVADAIRARLVAIR